MSATVANPTTWQEDLERLESLDIKEQDNFLNSLSKNRRKKVMAELTKKVEAAPDPSSEIEDEEETLTWQATLKKANIAKGKQPVPVGGGSGPADGPGGGGAPLAAQVTDTEIDDMWQFLDSDDMTGVDDTTLASWDYVGFDARTVISTFIQRGKAAGKSVPEIKSDLTNLCGLAHKKGSVTDRNYAKMEKSGQALYDALASVYSLHKGGAQGKDSTYLTVSRIGPSAPGRILRMLQAGKLAPKSFTGPLKSNTLASIVQTQAFSAAIPENLEEKAKDHIKAMVIAYGADATHAFTAGKAKVEDSIARQKNFLDLALAAPRPNQQTRLEIFRKVDWGLFYDKSVTCASAYAKLDPGFSIISRTDFLAATNKLI